MTRAFDYLRSRMTVGAKIAVTAMAFGLLMVACKKENTFPEEPIIVFESLEQFGTDSAHVIISFTDGDGDIGFRQADTLAPYNFVPFGGTDFTRSENQFYYNLMLRQNELVEGVWEELPFEIAPITYYRISDISPTAQDPTLEGEMLVRIGGPFPEEITENSDSIKFTIQLFDRALNESNVVETPLIVSE